jgi:hypothetical protein
VVAVTQHSLFQFEDIVVVAGRLIPCCNGWHSTPVDFSQPLVTTVVEMLLLTEPFCASNTWPNTSLTVKRWVLLSMNEAKIVKDLNVTFGYHYKNLHNWIEFHVDYWTCCTAQREARKGSILECSRFF